jgi:hypothetical protein
VAARREGMGIMGDERTTRGASRTGAGRPAPEIALLLQLLDEAYIRKAWHGPNLRGALRGLDTAVAAWRPELGRHNIWEIVVHCAYWKYAVRRRILGEQRGAFPIKGSNWFVRPEVDSCLAWRADTALLEDMHRNLRAAVAGLAGRDLEKIPRGNRLPNRAVVLGIAAHDVYHAGQVQLLKRLARRPDKETRNG